MCKVGLIVLKVDVTVCNEGVTELLNVGVVAVALPAEFTATTLMV